MDLRKALWRVGLCIAAASLVASASLGGRGREQKLYIAGGCATPSHSRLIFQHANGIMPVTSVPLIEGDCITTTFRESYMHCCSEYPVPASLDSCAAPIPAPDPAPECLREVRINE